MGDYLPLADHKNEARDYQRAKELRQSPSPVEQLLWNQLRKAPKESGVRFRRQHPLHPYIVDFVCLELKLVIEVDGASHEIQQSYDKRRDQYLNGLGYAVLRFSNDDVVKNTQGVVETILQRTKELKDSD